MNDDEFIRKYDAHESESIEEFIARNSGTAGELHDVISFLIHRRQLLCDCALEGLEHACQELVQKLADTKRKMAIEELECFHDILKLQRQLPDDDKPRD